MSLSIPFFLPPILVRTATQTNKKQKHHHRQKHTKHRRSSDFFTIWHQNVSCLQAVKVCDATVRKRLLEFEATPTSQMTVEQLNKLPDDAPFPGMEDGEDRQVGGATAGAGGAGVKKVLTGAVQMDPPAFIANR